ncbi:MAG: iron ABC transporter permease [Pseudobutyrivibrio sp.]|nr:iron ABC transporter permease [Pseudobutyrivibrio sp.]
MQNNSLNNKKLILFIVASLMLLGLALVLSLILGSKDISLAELFSKDSENALAGPIFEKRIMRTVLGIMAGFALSIAGVLMQAITKNPIADPSIIGINSGAACTVVAAIAILGINSSIEYIIFALIGAALTACFVYCIAMVAGGGKVGPVGLALAGAATSTACSSVVSLIMLPNMNVMEQYRFWSVGSIKASSWDNIMVVLPFILAGIFIALILIPSLNVLTLGDETATGLGVNVPLIKAAGILASVLLCGATTAIAGPIGFLGLMIPHFVRIIIGGDFKTLIPLSAINGASLLLLSDVAGRVIGRPGELEVGVVTAFLGAPVFILLVVKGRAIK